MNDDTIPHAFVLRKTLCTTSSVSERGDMDSENHSVVIRSIGSHSVKSTVSRVITLVGIYYIINSKIPRQTVKCI